MNNRTLNLHVVIIGSGSAAFACPSRNWPISSFPYLTMAEGIKLCAQTFAMDVKQLSCCAG